MRKFFGRPSLASSILLSILSLTACSQNPGISVTGNSANSGTGTGANATNCDIHTAEQPLRIILMVDNSSSTDTSDPGNVFRVKTVEAFMSEYGKKGNLTYSFGYFSHDPVAFNPANLSFGPLSSSPFGTAAQELKALEAFQGLGTEYGTAYSKAFSALSDTVAKDFASHSDQSYIVIFMSDGNPTDLGKDAATKIKSLVSTLRNSAVNGGKSMVSVSSVYFGPASSVGRIANMQTVSNEGDGLFLDTNVSTAFTLESLIKIPGLDCSQ